jgi:hypothetical protein
MFCRKYNQKLEKREEFQPLKTSKNKRKKLPLPILTPET